MAGPDTYRPSSRLDLAPSFMSLGLPPEAFADESARGGTAFDASLCTSTDTLWLFKGRDMLAYDLRADKIIKSPTPISQVFAQGTLPDRFTFGIDSAVWGGPAFPSLACLFSLDTYVRYECRPDVTTEVDPLWWHLYNANEPAASTQRDWLRRPHVGGGWDGGPYLEPTAKLYGLREDEGRIHFFTRDGQYARHDLNTGFMDVGPIAIQERFALPDSFSRGIDFAFYGAGEFAEHIFFFSGFQFAEYDIRRKATVRTGAIEQRFPALALFAVRPQLFLVEEYGLDTYIGPLTLGEVVATTSILPGSRQTSVLITQTESKAATSDKRNFLESSSNDVIDDFYKKMDQSSQSEASSDSYQYRLKAMFHGDASANSLWGGEVNAKLAVDGGSDEQRNRLAKQAFASIANQTHESAQTVSQRVVNTEQANSITENVYSRQDLDLTNPSDRVRNFEYLALLQPYVSIMVLKNVKAAYSDGTRPPDVFALAELPSRLPALLGDPDAVGPLLDYIKHELARIQDSTGEMRAIVTGGTLQIDGRLQTALTFPDVTPPQTINVTGIIKAVRDWIQPTYKVLAIPLDDAGHREPVPIVSGALETAGP